MNGLIRLVSCNVLYLYPIDTEPPQSPLVRALPQRPSAYVDNHQRVDVPGLRLPPAPAPDSNTRRVDTRQQWAEIHAEQASARELPRRSSHVCVHSHRTRTRSARLSGSIASACTAALRSFRNPDTKASSLFTIYVESRPGHRPPNANATGMSAHHGRVIWREREGGSRHGKDAPTAAPLSLVFFLRSAFLVLATSRSPPPRQRSGRTSSSSPGSRVPQSRSPIRAPVALCLRSTIRSEVYLICAGAFGCICTDFGSGTIFGLFGTGPGNLSLSHARPKCKMSLQDEDYSRIEIGL
ncbi:hypothetical protein DFH08DRAFT_1082860 [Mycena albidolilacea]|uniref:Uncharacterized protein n=1 Tax=Mycena albidolilacea TaxID=1033008 RepID=A0AAD6ZS09_9AGAR|nr:hypothetical protein DFH08DRAFT_1082860 [Mycena albidolilacea]